MHHWRFCIRQRKTDHWCRHMAGTCHGCSIRAGAQPLAHSHLSQSCVRCPLQLLISMRVCRHLATPASLHLHLNTLPTRCPLSPAPSLPTPPKLPSPAQCCRVAATTASVLEPLAMPLPLLRYALTSLHAPLHAEPCQPALPASPPLPPFPTMAAFGLFCCLFPALPAHHLQPLLTRRDRHNAVTAVTRHDLTSANAACNMNSKAQGTSAGLVINEQSGEEAISTLCATLLSSCKPCPLVGVHELTPAIAPVQYKSPN